MSPVPLLMITIKGVGCLETDVVQLPVPVNKMNIQAHKAA